MPSSFSVGLHIEDAYNESPSHSLLGVTKKDMLCTIRFRSGDISSNLTSASYLIYSWRTSSPPDSSIISVLKKVARNEVLCRSGYSEGPQTNCMVTFPISSSVDESAMGNAVFGTTSYDCRDDGGSLRGCCGERVGVGVPRLLAAPLVLRKPDGPKRFVLLRK